MGRRESRQRLECSNGPLRRSGEFVGEGKFDEQRLVGLGSGGTVCETKAWEPGRHWAICGERLYFDARMTIRNFPGGLVNRISPKSG